MSAQVKISFDEESRIRVFEQEKYMETEQLKNDSRDFIKKVINLEEGTQALSEALDQYGAKIEERKLMAIGQRNKAESEIKNRSQRVQELTNLYNEKKCEIERQDHEIHSLEEVLKAQAKIIESFGLK